MLREEGVLGLSLMVWLRSFQSERFVLKGLFSHFQRTEMTLYMVQMQPSYRLREK